MAIPFNHTTEKVLIISGSARKEGATHCLVRQVFTPGEYQLIDLLDERIAPYRYTADYGPDDPFLQIVDAMLQHHVIVFATPVYWYAMGGLMKNFFDRFTDIVTVHKHLGRQLKGKTAGLLAVGADPELPEGFEVPFDRTAAYLHMTYRGSFYHSTKFPKENAAMLKAIAHFKHHLFNGAGQ